MADQVLLPGFRHSMGFERIFEAIFFLNSIYPITLCILTTESEKVRVHSSSVPLLYYYFLALDK